MNEKILRKYLEITPKFFAGDWVIIVKGVRSGEIYKVLNYSKRMRKGYETYDNVYSLMSIDGSKSYRFKDYLEQFARLLTKEEKAGLL